MVTGNVSSLTRKIMLAGLYQTLQYSSNINNWQMNTKETV